MSPVAEGCPLKRTYKSMKRGGCYVWVNSKGTDGRNDGWTEGNPISPFRNYKKIAQSCDCKVNQVGNQVDKGENWDVFIWLDCWPRWYTVECPVTQLDCVCMYYLISIYLNYIETPRHWLLATYFCTWVASSESIVFDGTCCTQSRQYKWCTWTLKSRWVHLS